MEISTVLLYVTVAILLVICARYVWTLVAVFFGVLKQMIVFYEILNGESHKDRARPVRLYTFACETRYLDEVTVNELYNFIVGSELQLNVDSKDEGIRIIHKGILSYSHILLFREMTDGSLRGMILFGFIRHKDYTFMKLGYTFFKNYYRGGPSKYLFLGFYALKEMIRRPLTPLYIIGTAFSYKSYLVSTKFKVSYPRYDRETPDFFRKRFSDFAHQVKREQDEYDEERFVIKMEWAHISEHHQATEEDLKNPHIKFFVTNNPGYTKGHTQVTAWRMWWPDIMTVIIQAVFKGTRRQSKDGPRRNIPASKKLLSRRYTFQEESANAYAVKMYQMDVGGDAVEMSAADCPLSPLSLKSPTAYNPEINFRF